MGESFTIQISSNLVSQLTVTGDKSKKKTRKPKPKTPTKVPKKPAVDSFEPHKGSSADAGWPLQAPLPPPALFLPITPEEVPPQISNEELDAIRSTLKESEEVVERLQKQEENMLQEVTKKVKDLHDKEFKLLPYQNPFLCLVEKEACLECYKENSKNPLKCGEVVTRFKNCVRISVQQASSAQ